MSADLFDALDDEDENKDVTPATAGKHKNVSARQTACPKCKQPMRRIIGKMGPFWGCTAYPECEARLYDRDGKPSETPDERYRCPVCTRPLARSDGSRKSVTESADPEAAGKKIYWYCLGYNKGCKVTLPDDNGHPAKAWRCPGCGHLLKQRTGKAGVFWGCSQYPLCQASFPDNNGEPRLVKEPAGKKR